MLALQISSTKEFMNKLLSDTTFDIFLLEEATLSTAVTYTIDGHINKEFYPTEEQTSDIIPYEFKPWSEIKGLCFNLIKGKHTPLFFKFVFHLKPEYVESMLKKANCEVTADSVRALVLSVKYDGSKITLTTGSAFNTFVMNKEPDILWDKNLLKHLDGNKITYELL